MWMYIKIAVRNVHKNLKSMAFNGVGIALTAMLLVLILSFSRGIETQIVQRNIRFETGGMVIQFDKDLMGWENQHTGDSLYQRVLHVLNTYPEGYRPRITIYNASLYAQDAVQRVKVEGIEYPEMELLNEIVPVVEGDTDWQNITNGLLISKELSQETGLTPGSECVIVLPTADGSVNMQEYRVTGIFQNTSQADKYQMYMPYKSAKELYHVNLPTRILVDFTHLDDADHMATLLQKEVASEFIEVKTYKDFMGRAQALSGINRNGLMGVAFFLLFISFVGIWAMITEQVNERRKEMGTLLTLGFSRNSVKKIFLVESVYISIIFLGIGLLTVLTIIGIIEYFQGVYLGRLASFAFGSSTILPELRFRDVGLTVIICLFYPLLATFLSLETMQWKSIIKLMN